MLQFNYVNKTAVSFGGNAVLNFLGNEAIFVTIQEHQAWVKQFYESRNWYRFNPLIRMNFLTEEMGELTQVVRTIELVVITLVNTRLLQRNSVTTSRKNYATFLIRP